MIKKLLSDLCGKPTDHHQYLNFLSVHQNHTKRHAVLSQNFAHE